MRARTNASAPGREAAEAQGFAFSSHLDRVPQVGASMVVLAGLRHAGGVPRRDMEVMAIRAAQAGAWFPFGSRSTWMHRSDGSAPLQLGWTVSARAREEPLTSRASGLRHSPAALPCLLAGKPRLAQFSRRQALSVA